MKTLFKKSLFLLLFLSFSHSVAYSQIELITMISKVIHAERYWKGKKVDIQPLKNSQKKLAQTLGNITQNNQLKKEIIKRLKPEIEQILEQFAIPSHLERYKKVYIGVSAGAVIATIYLKSRLGNQSIYKLFTHTFIEPFTNFFEPTATPKKRGPSPEMLQSALQTLTQIALEEGNYKELFSEFEKSSQKANPFKNFEELQLLRDKIIEIGEANGILNGLSYNIGRRMSLRNSALLNAYLSEYIEFKIKCFLFFEGVKKFTHYLSLAPTVLLTLGGYKGTKTALNQKHQQTVIIPLTQDLKDFESFLYDSFDSPKDDHFYGMHIYWIERFKEYINLITIEQRTHFESNLAHLTPTIPIERQLNIVTSILQNGLPHF